MGRVITHTYGQPIGVLKFFEYKAFADVATEAMASADANGNKIVKAGTPFPANNATCKGYILEDVDVTNGDAPCAVVYVGSIDVKKLTANGITVTDEAKGATPRVTFFA